MALMTWNESYSVGVSAFDGQHRHLIELINDLHDAMLQGKAHAAISETLSRLVAYTKSHFAEEEAMMQRHGYPNFDAHRREHTQLTNQVLDFQKRFESGELALSVSLLTFLRDWLQSHIVGTDRVYSGFLNRKGVH